MKRSERKSVSETSLEKIVSRKMIQKHSMNLTHWKLSSSLRRGVKKAESRELQELQVLWEWREVEEIPQSLSKEKEREEQMERRWGECKISQDLPECKEPVSYAEEAELQEDSKLKNPLDKNSFIYLRNE
jgi:hypothetical protein